MDPNYIEPILYYLRLAYMLVVYHKIAVGSTLVIGIFFIFESMEKAGHRSTHVYSKHILLKCSHLVILLRVASQLKLRKSKWFVPLLHRFTPPSLALAYSFVYY